MDVIFPRRLRRASPIHVAAATLGLTWIVLVAAFAYSAISVQPTPSSLAAVGAAVLIAATGILYAWREPASRQSGA